MKPWIRTALACLVFMIALGIVGNMSGCCNKKPSPVEPIKTDTRYNPDTQYAELE